MKISLTNRLEIGLFRHRLFVLMLFVVASIFLLFQATQIKLDASFTKNIPLNHSYMKTYLKHRTNFGGANNILISVCDNEGDIFNVDFFTSLKGVHDKLFFIPGVDRIQVKSLFSPSTRFVEVVEDGFAGGPVIPADFTLLVAETTTIQSSEFPRNRPVRLGLKLPVPAKRFEPLRAKIVDANGRTLDAKAMVQGTEKDSANLEIATGWLSPGHYLIHLTTQESSHLPLRRYPLEVR